MTFSLRSSNFLLTLAFCLLPCLASGQSTSKPFPPTVRSLADAFDRGDRLSNMPELRQTRDLPGVIRQILSAGNPWPSIPRREAVFGLEVLAVALASDDAGVQGELPKIADYYAAAARRPAAPPVPSPDTFECGWHWAAIAAFEGAYRPVPALAEVDRALERCRAEPRFLLARAVLTDQRWPVLSVIRDGRAFDILPLNAMRAREVLAQYQVSMSHAETIAEARVRAAWYLYRSARLAEALPFLDNAGLPSADAELRCIAAIVRGRILRGLGRLDEATQAYRAALDAWPTSQSARVALMTMAVAHGDRGEGESLAESVQTMPENAIDPWWWFWQGDAHLFWPIVTSLRDLAK